MKRYMLTEPAFIGLALLAAGSIITDNDLPEGPEMEPGHWDGLNENRVWVPAAPKEGGKMIRSKPPKSSIEVDENGQPVRASDIGKIAAAPVTEIAPVAPHAPNPTAPQALPPHAVGDVVDPTKFAPAAGVESDEAAAARAEQADKIADAAKAATQPQRRGAAKADDKK